MRRTMGDDQVVYLHSEEIYVQVAMLARARLCAANSVIAVDGGQHGATLTPCTPPPPRDNTN